MSAEVSIAISATRIAIAWRHGTTVKTTGKEYVGDSLQGALLDALSNAPSAVTARIIIGRPLANASAISLPRMSRDNVLRVLTRDASRYVITDGATMSVNAKWIGENRYAVVFVRDDLLQLLESVASEQGWKHFEICSSDDVLASATRNDANARDDFAVICDQHGPTLITQVVNGMSVLGRTLPPNARASDIHAFIDAADAGDARGSDATVALLGNSASAAAVATELGKHGYRSRIQEAGLPANASSAAILAAAGAQTLATLPLRSHRAQAELARRHRLLNIGLIAAAIVAIFIGFSLQHGRITRELARIDQQRAEISAQVANALAKRASVQRQTTMVAALAGHERVGSAFTSVLTAVSTTLPPEVSLTMLEMKGDTVTIEGESSKSADVYEALRKMAALQNLKQTAALRRERGAGDTMIEHFAFSARLRPASGTP